jgi:hypothetical protein
MIALMWDMWIFHNISPFLQVQFTIDVAAVLIAFIRSILGEGESLLKLI